MLILYFYVLGSNGEISYFMGSLINLGIPLIVFGVSYIQEEFYPVWHPVMVIIVVFLFGTYLLLVIQKLAKGGDGSWTKDDYAAASMSVYTQISLLFSDIKWFSKKKEEEE